MIRQAYRYFRRHITNARLRRSHSGLILGDANISNTTFGKFNLISDRTSLGGSSLDDYSYVGIGATISQTEIGKFCAIGPGVIINPGIHPSRDFVSSHPAFYSLSFRCENRFAKAQGFKEHGKVTIGHDVWIGANAIISPNITIGTGAIIAAGAVVTSDVEPYAIVGGVPAKRIRFRFENAQVETILNSQWWNWDFEILKSKHEFFHNFDRFEKMIQQFKSKNDSTERQI